MTRRLVLAATLCALPVLYWHTLHAQQPDYPRPANHKLIMENALVRVFDIRMAPGMSEARHRHQRGLTIALSDYDNETVTYPSGEVRRSHTAFGDVRWAEPVVHEARNVGTTEQRGIPIEIK